MERLKIYYLKVGWCIWGLLACSCTQERWYKKTFHPAEQRQLVQQLLNASAESKYYYQGSVPDQFLLAESLMYDSTLAAAWREVGTAYLKRGMAKEFYEYYEKAAELDPVVWRGWMGYMYLYFYRDFERAIADFNATDTLTPHFTDYPQGQSVDYMRGIAYYGLGDYTGALPFFTKYIAEVTQEEGEEWVDVYAFLYRGLTWEKLNQLDLALLDFATVLKYSPRLSDTYYHQSRIQYRLGNYQEAMTYAQRAEEWFKKGYFHQRPYIEVLEQIYEQDIEHLKTQLPAGP